NSFQLSTVTSQPYFRSPRSFSVSMPRSTTSESAQTNGWNGSTSVTVDPSVSRRCTRIVPLSPSSTATIRGIGSAPKSSVFFSNSIGIHRLRRFAQIQRERHSQALERPPPPYSERKKVRVVAEQNLR